jgi:hypothetical protein
MLNSECNNSKLKQHGSQPKHRSQREKMEAEKRMGALQAAAEMQDGKEREVMRIGAELAKQLSSQAHQKEMQKPKGQ